MRIVPGRAVGGLLIMHSLYVTSHLSVTGPHIKTQLRDCLAWIGSNMGIGEATVLASVRALITELVLPINANLARKNAYSPTSLLPTAMPLFGRGCYLLILETDDMT